MTADSSAWGRAPQVGDLVIITKGDLSGVMGGTNAMKVRWLRAAGAPGVIIGGVAASFLGRPRATRDVVDLGRVRRWLHEFSSALDSSEMLEEFERIVSRRR